MVSGKVVRAHKVNAKYHWITIEQDEGQALPYKIGDEVVILHKEEYEDIMIDLNECRIDLGMEPLDEN